MPRRAPSRTRPAGRPLGPLLLLVGCSGCNPAPEVVRPDDLRSVVAGASALVVVYSRTGHTAKMGKAFAQALGADYQRLQGSGGEGGSWFSTPSWTDRVKVTPLPLDLRPYRLVLVGGPLWYWKPNALTASFIAGSDLAGKDVVLFYTFEGGGMSASTLEAWRMLVEGRGGRVVDVVGIDRKLLPEGRSVSEEAARIAGERMALWRPASGQPEPPQVH